MSLAMIPRAATRPYVPQASKFDQPFWEALAGGQLLCTHCVVCDALSFPPQPSCPECRNRATQWYELTGQGRLYSATRVAALPGPFAAAESMAVAVVDLVENLRIICEWLDEAATPPLDAPVELVVIQYTDGPLLGARVLDSM